MKKYKFTLIAKKNNVLVMNIECFDKGVKRGLEKQLRKCQKYIEVKESVVDE